MGRQDTPARLLPLIAHGSPQRGGRATPIGKSHRRDPSEIQRIEEAKAPSVVEKKRFASPRPSLPRLAWPEPLRRPP